MKIIAEIGTNHEGDLNLACEMIEKFANAGADIIKFQAFVVEDMIDPRAAYYDRMKQLEVKEEWYPILMSECKKNNVEFLSTATSFLSLKWMEKVGASMYKVASGNATHYPILDELIKIDKPIILSLGLLEISEIYELVSYFESKKFTKFSLLHCHVEYPTPINKANLTNIALLKEMFPHVKIGYSDHTLSILTPSIAISLGAEIIEKHVYLRRGALGMDYGAAIDLDAFRKMVVMLKETKEMLKNDFRVTELKQEYRRSFHTKREIQKGERLSFSNLKISRPENGIEPKYYHEVLGRKAKQNLDENIALQWEDIL